MRYLSINLEGMYISGRRRHFRDWLRQIRKLLQNFMYNYLWAIIDRITRCPTEPGVKLDFDIMKLAILSAVIAFHLGKGYY